MINIEILLLFIILIVNIFLFLSILRSQEKYNVVTRKLFSYVLFFIIIWIISILITEIYAESTSISLWTSRLSFASSVLITMLYNFFVRSFGKKHFALTSMDYFLVIPGAIIFILLSFSRFVVESVEFINGEYLKSSQGDLYILIVGYFIFTFFYSTIILWVSWREEMQPVLKAQKLNILIGATASIIFTISTNLILPLLNFREIRSLGPTSLIFFVSFTSYAIVQHRLFSIRTLMLNVLRSIFIGLILFFIVIIQRITKEYGFNLDTFATEALLLDLVTSVIVASFIQNLFFWVEKKLSKVVKAEIFMLESLAKEIDKQTADNLDMDFIVNRVVPILEKGFLNTKFYFVRTDNNQIIFPKNTENIIVSSKLLLRIKSTMIVQEHNEDNLLTQDLIDKKIGVVAPILSRFYLIIQSVNERELYSKTELDILEEIITKLRDIFARVEVHEKTVKFNEELKERVNAATKDLKQTNEKLQEALRKEKDLVDIFSHELRTPVGTARNSVQMINVIANKPEMSKEEFLEKTKEYSSRAVENMRRLSSIITRMLNASKLDTDEMTVNITAVDATDVINDSYNSFKEKARDKGIELIIKKPNTPLSIKADRVAIQQVIDNLVDNAIKYTESGSVTLILEELENFIKFIVKDTGIGIPKEEIAKLGRKFYRIDNYLRDDKKDTRGGVRLLRPDGTGIGLYVVKGLVRMMKGSLEVSSKGRGLGSTFTVYLPK